MKRQLHTTATITTTPPPLPLLVQKVEEISAREFGNPLIARGAFGEISIAIQSVTQNNNNNNNNNYKRYQFVALKKIRNAVLYSEEKSSYEFTPAVFTELASLRTLTPHPNITPLLDIKYDNNNDNKSSNRDPSPFFTSSISSTSLSFVFPYCPIDLNEIISHRRINNQHFHPFVIKYIIQNICHGLEHCHSKGILHCDIKPGNIVLSSNGIFQLADFGIARPYHDHKRDVDDDHDRNNEHATKIHHQQQQQHGLCTLYYRPPELLYGSTIYEPSIDMWGVGLILTELCSLRPLFPGCSVLDQLSRILNVLGTPTEQSYPKVHLLPDYSKVQFDISGNGIGLRNVIINMEHDLDLMHLIEHLVIMNPDDRLSASECLNHSYITKGSFDNHYDTNDDDNDKGFRSYFILKDLIFNHNIRGDCTEYLIHQTNDENEESLLKEMKVKGVAIAQARRKLSSFDNFELRKQKMIRHDNEVEDVANILSRKMKCCNFQM